MNARIFSIIIFIIAIPLICKAPPAGPSTCYPATTCIPIDGGISMLVAAGAIYGGKKLYSNRKEKKTF